MKLISICISLDNSRRPYVETILSGRVHAREHNVRITAEPFEQTFIASEQVRFRAMAKLIREGQEGPLPESLL
jgi:hypothetical protein